MSAVMDNSVPLSPSVADSVTTGTPSPMKQNKNALMDALFKNLTRPVRLPGVHPAGGDSRIPDLRQPRIAGQIRPVVPVAERLGSRQSELRCRGADHRHAADLGHCADHRGARLVRHRHLPDRVVADLAAPPARHRRGNAGRDPVDHLRHVGPVRLRAGVPAVRAALPDRHPGQRAPSSGASSRVRRSASASSRLA